jgi:hypothetical protein
VPRRLKQLCAGFILTAILELAATSPIRGQGAQLSLVQKWQAVLPAGRRVIFAASCPNGELFALDANRGVLTFDSTGNKLRDDPALLKSPLPLLAVCDAQNRLYVVGTSLSIFDPDAHGMLHSMGDAQLSSKVQQVAILEDGSVLLFSDTSAGALPQHFAHDGKKIKEKGNLQKTLHYSIVRSRPGTCWSGQIHVGPPGDYRDFYMENGEVARQETVRSEIADIYNTTYTKVQDGSGNVIWSSDENQDLGLLVGSASKGELLFVKKAGTADALICYALETGDLATRN